MKNIIDLRFVIGAFFFLAGIFLFIASFVTQSADGKSETINFYCGILYALFGIVMLLLWRFHRGAEK